MWSPVRSGGVGGVAVDEGAVEVLALEHLAEPLHAPVLEQELQARSRAQPAVAVVPEHRDHALPHVGHLVERDPHAELLREHRVGGQAAPDPEVEAGPVHRVRRTHEGDVVDLGGDVLARVAADRGLELAGQVGVLRVAEVAAGDLLDRGRAVDDLVGRDAGDGGAEHHARGVAAGLERVEADRVEPLPDGGHVLDADPVQLHVLPVGDVGGVAGVRRADLADRAELLGGELAAVDADPHHEELGVELLGLEGAGLAAVEAGLALGVEPHPAEAAAQVAAVDRGEAAPGVDVLDAGPDVERVVVLLGLLVGVQRLAVAERPLALAALGPGAARAAGTGGGRAAAGGCHGDALLGTRDARCAAQVPTTVSGGVPATARPAGGQRAAPTSTGRARRWAEADRSWSACDRGPRGGEPRGASTSLRRSWRQSHGSDTPPTNPDLMM